MEDSIDCDKIDDYDMLILDPKPDDQVVSLFRQCEIKHHFLWKNSTIRKILFKLNTIKFVLFDTENSYKKSESYSYTETYEWTFLKEWSGEYLTLEFIGIPKDNPSTYVFNEYLGEKGGKITLNDWLVVCKKDFENEWAKFVVKHIHNFLGTTNHLTIFYHSSSMIDEYRYESAVRKLGIRDMNNWIFMDFICIMKQLINPSNSKFQMNPNKRPYCCSLKLPDIQKGLFGWNFPEYPILPKHHFKSVSDVNCMYFTTFCI